jgi:signal transduction histidine kinase
MSDVGRVAFAARVFTLAALISVAALIGTDVLRGAVIVLVAAFWAQVFMLTGRLSNQWVAIIEGATVGTLAAITWPHNDAVTPYLIVPALIGGLTAGIRGALRVLFAEAIVTSGAWWLLVHHFERSTSASILTWLFAGLGLGMLGTAFRKVTSASGTDASYRSALELIKQLHALSGRLTAGLDAVSLAERVMQDASRRLDIVQAVVVVRGASGTPTPLRFSDGAATESLLNAVDWADEAWETQRPGVCGHRIAVPLCADSQAIALLVADCVAPPEPRVLHAVSAALSPYAVQLHAAMLFGDVRDAATSEERQRLAREVHDGVAQDVASLGYIVDNLTDSATSEEQIEQLMLLRKEVSRVVAELRHSVFDLRNEVGAGQGLGQSISSFARHIGSHSDMTVHVTLNEAATRLRPDVESELLRIAQEAINNARKHSRGKNLWVTCNVQPPQASIEVRDDGNGLGHARDDSHGLRIMRERADRIGAELHVETAPELGGTRVSVRLPARLPSLMNI